MRKTLSFAAIALAVQLCHSMEFLSPEGQAAAKKLKHAEFIKTSDGKISEIKLKETNEIRQYRAEIKAEITGKLVEFFTKNSQQPNRVNYKEDIDKFFPIFDRRHSSSLHSYFVFNVLSEYCAAINHLFSLSIEKLNNEIKGILLPILDKYYKEITLYTEQYMPDKPQCIDFFLKCDEGNLGLFSTEISMELFAQLPAEFTFSRENIRIITADSIFAGFETLGLLPLNTITSYKKLMTKSQETDKNLLDRYTNLLQESRFIRLAKLTSEDFKIKCYTFKQKTDVEQYKKNVMQTIQASLDSLPKRQTFVLFLAVHEYICVKCNSTSGIENKLLFEDRDMSDGDASAYYPEFAVNVDPKFSLEVLTFTATQVKPSVLGYEKITLDTPAILAHEFRHGYHLPLGLGIYDDSTYLQNYLSNPFMKDLLFQDFYQIRSDLKQDITEILGKLSEVDAVQFSEQIKSYFTLPLMLDLSDKTLLAESLSDKLALETITQIWGDPEEIQNIIGIQIVGKTLFVNRLSDLNVSITKGERPRWTHLSGNKEHLKNNLLPKGKDNAPVTNIAAQQFIMNFHAKYGTLADLPLNHPATKALRVLEILHNVSEGSLTKWQ